MTIRERIESIRASLSKEVTLIAVSKTRAIEELNEVYDYGIRDFGENKVQELTDKANSLPADIRWHLIGHLQRNKVKYIVNKVFLIHSLDSVRLLEEIEKQYKAKESIANVLIQVNIGREESKTGILLEELNDLIAAVEGCENVKVKGLMAIIPIGDEESCRKYFKDTKKLFDKLSKEKFKNITMEYLSMGMTHDYKIAVEEGSNMVRVGEGIFGKRIYNK